MSMIALILSWSQTAHAQACPSPYDNSSCNSKCVLFVNAGYDEIECDLSDSTTAVEAHAVTDYLGTSTPNYSVFGEDDDGNFCCWFDDPDGEIGYVTTIGSDLSDFLENNWAAVDLVYMAVAGGVSSLSGTIAGLPLDDLITGSDDDGEVWLGSCAEDYCEFLDGNNGDDEIYGYGGTDYLEGGYGDDFLYGGDDADDIRGMDDDDYLNGLGGDDFLYGGAGLDVLLGSIGADTLDGGSNDDILCGGSGTGDHLDSGGGNDTLWAPGNSVSPTGVASSTDHCGNTTLGTSWAGGSCIYDLTTIPTACN